MAEERQQDAQQHDRNYSRWKHDAIKASGAGVATTLLTLGGAVALGHATPYESKALLEAIMPTSRFLFSGVMTATATTLALMLTLLGMTSGTDQRVAATFYRRIQQIAFYNMLLLVMSTVFLVMHCVPITKSDEIPTWWYPGVYYFLLSSSALTAGGMVCVVLMLYGAVRDLIHAVGLETDVGVFIEEDDLKQEDAQAEAAGS